MLNDRRCRECGCTEDNACQSLAHGRCYWIEPDLCSFCAFKSAPIFEFKGRPTDFVEGGFLFGIGFMIALAAGWLGWAGIQIFL